MKVTELIAKLVHIHDEYGDIDVKTYSDLGLYEIELEYDEPTNTVLI